MWRAMTFESNNERGKYKYNITINVVIKYDDNVFWKP